MLRNDFNPLRLFLIFSVLFVSLTLAKPAKQLERDVDNALEAFKEEVHQGDNFLSKVKGYLVFPSVYKGGFILGGEYGEGALRIEGQTKYYYSMTSGSIGYQAGAQVYSIVIAFITDTALNNFIRSNGWEAGVDGSITVTDWGEGKDMITMSYEKPIVAFMYGQKGLMASASIKGTKFLRIIPQ